MATEVDLSVQDEVIDFDEVRTLDAGSWFVAEDGGPQSARDFDSRNRLDSSQVRHFESGQVIIPTLSEALLFTRESVGSSTWRSSLFPKGRAVGRARLAGDCRDPDCVSSVDFVVRPPGRRGGKRSGPRICVGYPGDDAALSSRAMRELLGPIPPTCPRTSSDRRLSCIDAIARRGRSREIWSRI